MDSKGHTQDGTVDLRGKPVLAEKTGKWKACALLVGKLLIRYSSNSIFFLNNIKFLSSIPITIYPFKGVQ